MSTTQTRTPAINENAQNKPATRPHVVVVGAGFGGLATAKRLGKLPLEVTVIDHNNFHLFQPMLYQVATAGLSPADISAPIRHILRDQRNTGVLMAEVTGVDMQEQQVHMHDQSIHYDYLIVATGATSNYFGHEEWKRLAPGMKTLDEAITVRRVVLSAFEAAEREPDEEKRQALLTFVLVGGGPTGVELAGSIAELTHNALLGDFQVEIHTGVHVKDVKPDGVMIGNEHLAAENVIWTAGVKASPAAQWLQAPADHDGRVKVQRDLTIPGHSNIFVIGDTALVIENGKKLPGLAPVAMQEGRYVASVIADRIAGKTVSASFHYFDKGTMATVGRSFGVVDIGPLHFTGFFAWLTWLFVHILFLIGARNRVLVFFQYAWSYFTFQRGARVILPGDTIREPG